MMMRISFSWMMKDAGKVALKLLQCFLHVRSHHLPLQVFITIYSCNILCGNFQYINWQDVNDDALFHTSDVPQLLSGIKEFKKDIQVDKLTTKCELDIAKKRCLCTDCANDKCERIGE